MKTIPEDENSFVRPSCISCANNEIVNSLSIFVQMLVCVLFFFKIDCRTFLDSRQVQANGFTANGRNT